MFKDVLMSLRLLATDSLYGRLHGGREHRCHGDLLARAAMFASLSFLR